MLMVTCTDMAVLAGAYPEACFAKYGSYPTKGKHCHEQAHPHTSTIQTRIQPVIITLASPQKPYPTPIRSPIRSQ